MVDEAANARKSTSFDFVSKEINNTIEQAEASLERFLEDQDSREDLRDFNDDLSQLRGIFTLVELQGAAVLCQESVSLAGAIPGSTNEDSNKYLVTLSQALFVLRRYTEYFDKRREDHPELLLDSINRLRKTRNLKPLHDCYFFNVAIRKVRPTPRTTPELSGELFQQRSRILRHMYQVGLLNLLRKTEREVALGLLHRSANGFLKLCQGSSLANVWELAATVSDVMLKQRMNITPSRQRLFMRIEKYAKEITLFGKGSSLEIDSETVMQELLYIITLSGHTDNEVNALLGRYNVGFSGFDEKKLEAHRSLLMGPGSDVLTALAKALHEEINQIKDKLDIIERGIAPEEGSLEQISTGLSQLADTLTMLDLTKLSDIARQLQTKLKSWVTERRQPNDNDLLVIADSVLSIEQAIAKLEEEGLTVETDRLAGKKASVGESPFLSEAMIVVLGESKNCILAAKRSITAYLEAGGDSLHLTNVLPGLEAVRGALLMIGQSRTAQAISATANFIQESLVKATSEPDEHTLETLADALTSLEYYVDSLNRSAKGNIELLMLAEESVKSFQ